MIIAIAFVPIPKIDEAFSALMDAFPDEFRDELQNIADWLEDYYLGRLQRSGHRRSPLFPPAIW